MNWSTPWLAWRLRYRVVHRLPGRLRVHAPALRRIDATRRPVIVAMIQDLGKPAGIGQLELTFMTGSILIEYDQYRLSETQVLDWLAMLRGLIGQTLSRLAALDPEARVQAVSRLLDFLRTAAERGTKVDTDFEIPESIWAQDETAAGL